MATATACGDTTMKALLCMEEGSLTDRAVCLLINRDEAEEGVSLFGDFHVEANDDGFVLVYPVRTGLIDLENLEGLKDALLADLEAALRALREVLPAERKVVVQDGHRTGEYMTIDTPLEDEFEDPLRPNQAELRLIQDTLRSLEL